jgi:hypothetical protein
VKRPAATALATGGEWAPRQEVVTRDRRTTMKKLLGTGLIVVIALAGLSWLLGYLAYRVDSMSSEEARTQLVSELEQFEAIEAHRSLLLDTVDRGHSKAFQRNQLTRRRHSVLSWDGYRTQMYRELGEALREAGHADVAVQLDRYRARTE